MAKHKITLLPGDGIGPEVTAAVVSIIECAGVEVEWEKYFVGAEALSRFCDPLPADVLESILRNKVALKGPVTTPVGTGFSSINVRLRKALDLYANLRPVKSAPNIKTRYDDVDLVVVRENTEDLYSGLEHEVVPGVVESLKIITERASTRIAQFAFQHARANGRKKVTSIHKANIMKLSDGLFIDCDRHAAREYIGIIHDERIVEVGRVGPRRPGDGAGTRRAALPRTARARDGPLHAGGHLRGGPRERGRRQVCRRPLRRHRRAGAREDQRLPRRAPHDRAPQLLPRAA